MKSAARFRHGCAARPHACGSDGPSGGDGGASAASALGCSRVWCLWGGGPWPPRGPGGPISSAGPTEPLRLLGSGQGAGGIRAQSPQLLAVKRGQPRSCLEQLMRRRPQSRVSGGDGLRVAWPCPPRHRWAVLRAGGMRGARGLAVPAAPSAGKRGVPRGIPAPPPVSPQGHGPSWGGPVPRAMLLTRVGSPGEVGARRRAEFSSERSLCGEQASLLGDSLPWGHGSAVMSCAHAGGSSAHAALPGLGPACRGGGTVGSVRGQQGGLWLLPDGGRGLSLPQPRPAGHGTAGSGERLCPGTSTGRGAEPPVWVGAPTLPRWVAGQRVTLRLFSPPRHGHKQPFQLPGPFLRTYCLRTETHAFLRGQPVHQRGCTQLPPAREK